ncbi:unnamed protein product [Lactuca virosa]|uniref:Ubiquitin-like protease family profile domain-containing protein n=1 Tax=Lactuca virosa TaxID=75947 RepID=A0AAU9MF84_9ASTR|nr:unnamed protein product [Lactuca virosa]
MGLGSLLRIATNGISGKLARFVVNSFNPSDMKIHLPNAKIDITPELVHDLLGIPLGGKDIYNTDQCEGKELMDWKQQYNFKAMRPSDVEEKIKESSDSGIIFRTNFVLLFVNTICEQNKPGTCKTTVLPHLLGKTPMREIDWCGFITNCLKMSKTTWDETDRGNYYCGPLLVLLLAYLEFMRNDKNEKRQIHALHFWDYEMMVKREKAELKSGDFGTSEWNDDVIENDEESDTDENEDMKLDVCASKFVDPDEVKVSDRIFSRIGNSSEKVFQNKRWYVLGRGMIETMQAGLWVHAHVIDAWTDILNYEEKLKSNSTMNRYFFDTSIVFIFDKNIPFNQRFDKFESNIKDAMKKDKELLTFEKVHLVFLPVHQKNHFYIICINLEEPAVDVIDNRNSVVEFSRAYRDAPNELVLDEGQSQISFNFGGC